MVFFHCGPAYHIRTRPMLIRFRFFAQCFSYGIFGLGGIIEGGGHVTFSHLAFYSARYSINAFLVCWTNHMFSHSVA